MISSFNTLYQSIFPKTETTVQSKPIDFNDDVIREILKQVIHLYEDEDKTKALRKLNNFKLVNKKWWNLYRETLSSKEFLDYALEDTWNALYHDIKKRISNDTPLSEENIQDFLEKKFGGEIYHIEKYVKLDITKILDLFERSNFDLIWETVLSHMSKHGDIKALELNASGKKYIDTLPHDLINQMTDRIGVRQNLSLSLDVSETDIECSAPIKLLITALNKSKAIIRKLDLSKNLLRDDAAIELQKLERLDTVRDLSLSIDAMSPETVEKLFNFLYEKLKNNKDLNSIRFIGHHSETRNRLLQENPKKIRFPGIGKMIALAKENKNLRFLTFFRTNFGREMEDFERFNREYRDGSISIPEAAQFERWRPIQQGYKKASI